MIGLALPNFKIQNGVTSNLLINIGISDFHQSLEYVKKLPYGRNTIRSDFRLVIEEMKGTCSTKHALLAEVCKESGMDSIKLMTGIYEMDEENTPGVGEVLRKYKLDYIPEAHCYLKYNGKRYDFTMPVSSGEKNMRIVSECEIGPAQIGEYKINYHRSYIANWVHDQQLTSRFDLNRLWAIREECIKNLSK
ncbi:hypothetical protein CEY16_13605 [Halalkalibacillus sediminis]|uniref:Uncharacterized protein n=1 Tax=Halalkalibacillus sediminis TaxID=2018042 RepID=A0A2I0QR73_9BACI|nr:hypothetical protein [Halalkalibacillus sediminis]PKR76845.1 hypothetical protein CEY16_13605 [Halalkalibacillus sediminis]